MQLTLARYGFGLAVGLASAVCVADNDFEIKAPRQLFEWGVRAGPGVQYFVPPLCIMEASCGPTYSNAPTIGFDTYLRIGTDNTRWMNQASFAFARDVTWSDEVCVSDFGTGDCPTQTTSGTIATFIQMTFTTGLEVNTNPRGEFGFLWELGAMGGVWMAPGAPGTNGVGGLKIGLGAMLFHDWEVTTQFIVGNVVSAQVLVGYNVQWGR